MSRNLWIEGVLSALIQRQLSDEETDHYRQPFASPGEDRRPTLSWPRHLPVEGDPADVAAIVNEYGNWLAGSEVPKLFINAEPGEIINDRVREIIRTWPSLTETTVSGRHFIQGSTQIVLSTSRFGLTRGDRCLRRQSAFSRTYRAPPGCCGFTFDSTARGERLRPERVRAPAGCRGTAPRRRRALGSRWSAE